MDKTPVDYRKTGIFLLLLPFFFALFDRVIVCPGNVEVTEAACIAQRLREEAEGVEPEFSNSCYCANR